MWLTYKRLRESHLFVHNRRISAAAWALTEHCFLSRLTFFIIKCRELEKLLSLKSNDKAITRVLIPRLKNKLLRTPWRPRALWRHPPPHLNCVWTSSPAAVTYRLSSTLRCVWFCFLVNFTWRNAAAGLSRNSFCSTGRCWDPPTPTHSFSLLITISIPLHERAWPTDLFYCWRTMCSFPVWGY